MEDEKEKIIQKADLIKQDLKARIEELKEDIKTDELVLDNLIDELYEDEE